LQSDNSLLRFSSQLSEKVNEKNKMSFAQKLSTENTPVQATARRKHVVIGHFKHQTTILDAGRYLAQCSNTKEETLSFSVIPSDSAQHILTTRTPMRYKRSIDLLDRLLGGTTGKATVFLDDFFDAPLVSDTHFRRFKERMRRIHLLNHLRTKVSDLTLVKNSRNHEFLLRLANAFALNQAETTPANGQKCSVQTTYVSDILIGSPQQPSLSSKQERAQLRQHLYGLHHTQRMSARMMNEHLDLLEEEDTELRDLAILAKSECLRKHPVVRRLRPQNRHFSRIYTTAPPFPMLAVAQSPSGVVADPRFPISRYADHLRSVFGLTKKFDLASPQNAQAFSDWYEKEAFERTPSLWTPPMETQEHDHGVIFPVPSTTEDDDPRAKSIAAFLSDPAEHPLDPKLQAHFAHHPAPKGPSRMAILMALLAKLEGPLPVTVEETWQSSHILNWYSTKVCQLFPFLGVFSKNAVLSEETAPPALTIVGLPNSNTGLGTNMKMSGAMMAHLNLPHSLIDVDHASPPVHRAKRGQPKIKHNAVLHHMNADRIPMTLMSPEHVYRNDELHIGYLLWETSKLPDAHRLALDMLDEVWVPSHFVADLYNQENGPPVHLVKKGLYQLGTLAELPASPKDKTVFTAMVCFDFHSSVERKNPIAAVQGFLSAFPRRHFADCRLIVKTTPTISGHWGDPLDQMGKIRALAAEDDRITVDDRMLSAADFWRFLQKADCLLSTHRAEGVGYLPAYAMALGIPIIATDYGGTRDFCTPSTASPIAYSLIDVTDGHSIYPAKGAKWAEVRRADVAKALREIYDNDEESKARARFGSAFVRREYSIAAYAARCQTRLRDLGVIG
jgi:hypothetical protein